MAGATKDEFDPLLPPGFHDHDLAALRVLCVDNFPGSVRRPHLMQRLEEVISLLNSKGIEGRIWIDGSFVTKKHEPDDVDVLLEVDEAYVNQLEGERLQLFKWFQATSLYHQYRCDNYVLVTGPDAEHEYMWAYWLRQFGFSRSEVMKGLAVIRLPLELDQ